MPQYLQQDGWVAAATTEMVAQYLQQDGWVAAAATEMVAEWNKDAAVLTTRQLGRCCCD